MKRRIMSMCGVAVVILTVPVGSARAQTTAVGPYYAVPSWDQTIACSSTANCPRFVVLSNMSNQAVLDRETGLVWQRSPRTAYVSYEQAVQICPQERTGGRFGWRLPSLHELGSLLVAKVVPANTTGTFLPDGHPFIGVTADVFWTGTFREGTSETLLFTMSLGVSNFPFDAGSPSVGPATPRNNPFTRMWCVRGGGPIPLN
jgi:uncharacterized protein DUF1566